MSKMFGNIKFVHIFFGKVETLPLFKGRGVGTKVNDNIKNLAFNASYKLCLLVDSLKMERTNNALVRYCVENLRKVVLKTVSLENLF